MKKLFVIASTVFIFCPLAACSNPTTETSNDCDIKGNISKSGEKIYHLPEQQFYDKTIAEETFCTEDEAKDAGYRKSKR
ncbi:MULTISPECIES: hypothetical protein [Bacillus cereus group]|uniref:sunset domain-containing protein n=1 Tax=Bacillus cereus group TaxID=86661 RepID=UPI0004511B51|nr:MULTISPECIES: hypothetical protein [Bacillus cereus group]EXY09188.1 hypothetical protein BF15_01265 [Bacillus thuringiensis]MEB8633046.1 hypothetical protein [Bacillus cereus]MEB8741817.1 hypothetical protein [Bacillus cereus]MEB8796434.1 hypothetical protein [Bacillus cereus]MEB8807064.1 hypothetical protein [Bacillus cereus]